MARDAATRVEERSVESSASAVEWGSIFAGGIAALGITVILLTLGPGFGLTAVSPWSYKNPTPAAFGTAAAIWLVVTQWLSSRLWWVSNRSTSHEVGGVEPMRCFLEILPTDF